MLPIDKAATAYHEAGHALAHYVLGWGNGRVTILEKYNSKGSAAIAHKARLSRLLRQLEYGTMTTRLFADCHDFIVCLLAGREAQKKFKPQSLHSYMARSDHQSAVDFLASLHPEHEERQAAMAYLTLRTRNLVSSPRNWSRITTLASELITTPTLTGEEVSVIFRAADDAFSLARSPQGP